MLKDIWNMVKIRSKDWKVSEFTKYCQDIDCNQKFGMINRKHHCRFCGEIFCNSCTSLRISINQIAKLTRREVDGIVNNKTNDDLDRICHSCLRKMLQVDCEMCGYSFCLLCDKVWHDKMLCFEA